MADLFTDSDDEKAVEELLCQAMDMAILEQVTAINNAGFKNSYLPSHLQTRFQNLKSFQSSISKPASLPSQSLNLSHSSQFKRSGCVKETKSSYFSEGNNGEKTEKCEKKFEQCGKVFPKCSKKSPETITSLSPSKPSEIDSFSHSKKNPTGKFGKKEKKSHSCYFWEGFSNIGWFLCYPNKVSRRKGNKNRGFDSGLGDEFLSDLSNFSVKNQEKMMKKAMKEEEKIRKDAEKIVEWVKHASAGMDVSDS